MRIYVFKDTLDAFLTIVDAGNVKSRREASEEASY